MKPKNPGRSGSDKTPGSNKQTGSISRLPNSFSKDASKKSHGSSSKDPICLGVVEGVLEDNGDGENPNGSPAAEKSSGRRRYSSHEAAMKRPLRVLQEDDLLHRETTQPSKRVRHVDEQDDGRNQEDTSPILKLDLRNTVRKRETRTLDSKDGQDSVPHKGEKRPDLRDACSVLGKKLDAISQRSAEAERALDYSRRRSAYIEAELEKTKELLRTRTEELTIAQAFMTTADRFSVADVCRLVEQLNDDIYQCSALLSDLVLESIGGAKSADSKELEESVRAFVRVWDESLIARVQADVANGDTVLLESIIQFILVRQCSTIFDSICPGNREVDKELQALRKRICQSHDPSIARNWVAMTVAQYKDDTMDPQPVLKVVTRIMIVAGWHRPNSSSSRYPEVLTEKYTEIATKAAKIKEMALEGVLSQEIALLSYVNDTKYQPGSMQGAFEVGKPRPAGAKSSTSPTEKILCTTALGVQCVRQRPMRRETILKAKVLLPSSLDRE